MMLESVRNMDILILNIAYSFIKMEAVSQVGLGKITHVILLVKCPFGFNSPRSIFEEFIMTRSV